MDEQGRERGTFRGLSQGLAVRGQRPTLVAAGAKGNSCKGAMQMQRCRGVGSIPGWGRALEEGTNPSL